MTADLPRTLETLEEGRERGLHFGGQLYASIDGSPVADLAFGDTGPPAAAPRRSDGCREMTPEHLMLWLSSSKPVTAVAIARLWEQGALELDDPVARHIPEFGVKGKETVTLRHLLTHTGGIRSLNVGWPERSWDEILANLSEMKLEPRWEPGRKAGYHVTSSWFVLGEVIKRLTGEDFASHVRRTIFEPLRMTGCWIGMPETAYRQAAGRIAPMYDTSADPASRLDWTNELRLTRASPGSNGVGPVRELGRFYEMLLGGGVLDNVRLLSPQSVAALTARHRVGLWDHTFRQTLDWGLGFVLDSRHYGEELPAYGYGEHASTRVFGHSGYRSSTALADPQCGLVVAIAVNGTPGGGAHRRRLDRVLTRVYEDLGLA